MSRIGFWAMTAYCLAIPALMMHAAAQDWEMDLTDQLAADRQCEVAWIGEIVEKRVDDRQTVSAKAHCVDGRVFTAQRADMGQNFALVLCQDKDGNAC